MKATVLITALAMAATVASSGSKSWRETKIVHYYKRQTGLQWIDQKTAERAYLAAVQVYGKGPRPNSILVFPSVLLGNAAGFYDHTNNSIWIGGKASRGEDPDFTLYVLTHEIGHALLTYNGVPEKEQHCLMYRTLDMEAEKILGIPDQTNLVTSVGLSTCNKD